MPPYAYEIKAEIAGGGCDKDNVWCLDPTKVVVRLREIFPALEIDTQDFAWKDYDAFKQRGIAKRAIQVAENDAQRRGPIWHFRLPLQGRPAIEGHVERYLIWLHSEEQIPDDVRMRVMKFLDGLGFNAALEIEVT